MLFYQTVDLIPQTLDVNLIVTGILQNHPNTWKLSEPEISLGG